MMRFLNQLFPVKTNEWEAVRYFFLVMLVFAFGSSIARSIGMTLLVEHLGGEVLPQIFIMVDTTAMLGLFAYAKYTKTVSGLRILIFFFIVATIFTLLSQFLFFLPWSWVYGLFFVGFFFIYILISIHIGSVVAAYFNTVQLKRVTGFINAGLPIGGILGGSCLVWLLDVIPDPSSLILVTAFAYWLGMLLLRMIQRRLTPVRSSHGDAHQKPRSTIEELKNGFFYIIHSRLMLYMAIGLLLFVVGSKFLEYQYQALIYPEIFPEAKERASFFAIYEIFGNTAWLLLQIFVTSRLFMKLGVGASNLLHPVLMLLVSLGLLFRFGFVAGVISQFVNQEMRGALRTPANNLLFNAVPPNMWGTTKAFLNGIIFPLATVIASSTLLLLKEHLPNTELMFYLPLLTLILSIIGIIMALPQWAAYNAGVYGLLDNNLFSRKAKVGKLNSLKQMLETKLSGEKTQEVIAALEMVRVVKLKGFEHPIGKLLRQSSDTDIKRHCVETLSVLPPSESILKHLLHALRLENNPATLHLILHTLQHFNLNVVELTQNVERFLLHPSPLVFTEALFNLYQHPDCSREQRDDLEQRLLIRLARPDLPDFSLYLRLLGHFQNPAYSRMVMPFLENTNIKIRLAAFQSYIDMLGEQLNPYRADFIDVLQNDDAKSMKIAALRALRKCSAATDWIPVIQLLGSKEHILVNESKALLHLQLAQARPVLEQRVFQPDIPTEERFEILSLIYQQLSDKQCLQLQQEADHALQHFIYLMALLWLYREKEPDNPSKSLVEKILLEIAYDHLRTVITAITYLSGETREFFHRISQGLLSESRANQGNALEVMSNARESYLADRLLRYFDERPTSLEMLDKIHQSLFKMPLLLTEDTELMPDNPQDMIKTDSGHLNMTKYWVLNARYYQQALMSIEHTLLRACLYYSHDTTSSHMDVLYEDEKTRELLGVIG
ncbi:NTP/NDP exchange transporter [Candidatus Venteria ishoeyi]|uniref:TLC ATP/ADP transporter n=1 Tax=Candidatus Venteria ishoeyi TaxID=1899563 RepID=A0A1H6FCH2_9GAMM|nr:hypothetical protein [Candidatus Venteria ishoeyi]MDM8545031.1 hypothetical protein [Candidatus Venteria ishoeyi]SEH07019.1 TLC ATP/ADP transporter [Candidatus Venteria ishoeyi]